MAIEYNTIEEALQDLRNGKCILVTDDPDRENEGDLICAGQFATTENVNLMASAAKGLICMPMSHDNIIRLGLTQMVSHNTDNHETAFTVSIDHIDTTTGISAVERGLIRQRIPATSAARDTCSRWRQSPAVFWSGMATLRRLLTCCVWLV